jgi:hypothetical protein
MEVMITSLRSHQKSSCTGFPSQMKRSRPWASDSNGVKNNELHLTGVQQAGGAGVSGVSLSSEQKHTLGPNSWSGKAL